MVDGATPRARSISAATPLPEGLFLPADADHRASTPPTPLMQEEIFGPVLVSTTFRTPAEAVRDRQQHPLRAGRDGLDREHQPRARHRAEAGGRRGLGQRHQHVRRRRRLRRRARKRLRPRRRLGRACRPIPSPSGTAKRAEADRAVRRGRRRRRPTRSTAPPSSMSAASRRGPTAAIRAPVYGPNGRAAGPVGAGQPQGHPQRGRGGAGAPRAGRRTTGHLRAQILYYIAENLSARARRIRRPHRRD